MNSLQKRGRPNKKIQLEILKKLQFYFERSYSASFTAQKLSLNIKTVCKHFRKFAEQIKGLEDRNFFERSRIDRERMILGYDSIISEYYDMVDDINEQISELKKDQERLIPNYLFQMKTNLLKNISHLLEKKVGFVMQPPLDESLKKIIQENVEKYVKLT